MCPMCPMSLMSSMSSMKSVVIDRQMMYDGSQIDPLWAYEHVVHVKDIEDEKGGKAIRGDSLIHLIVERFDSPANMRHAYYLQRILIVCVQDVLRNLGVTADRSGDDLFVDGGKLTVSIATAGISSEKIHCGINLTGRGTPAEANAVGLSEIGIDPDSWKEIGKEIADRFVSEIRDIESDICKTRPLA